MIPASHRGGAERPLGGRAAGRSVLRSACLRLLMLAAFTAPLDAVRISPIGSAADVTLGAAGIFLVLHVLARSVPPRLGPYQRMILGAGLLIVGGLIGTLFSASSVGASLVNILRFAVAVIGLPLMMAALRPARVEVRWLAWSFVLGCCLSSVVSAGGVNPATLRSAGLALHPNALGLSSAFAVCILVGLRVGSSRAVRWLSWPLLGVLLYGLSNSGSRAGFLALVAGGAALLWMMRQFRLVVAGALVALVAGGAIVTGVFEPPPESALGRVIYEGPSTRLSDLGRTRLRDEVILRVNESYVTGSGFSRATQAHNVPLQVLDSAGLVGIVGFVALVSAVLRRHLRRTRDPFIASGAAMFIGYLAAAPFANTMWDRWLWLPVALSMAATTTYPVAPSQRASSPTFAHREIVPLGAW